MVFHTAKVRAECPEAPEEQDTSSQTSVTPDKSHRPWAASDWKAVGTSQASLLCSFFFVVVDREEGGEGS